MTNESSVSTVHSHKITIVEHFRSNNGLGNQGGSITLSLTFLIMHVTKVDAGRSLMTAHPTDSVDESENLTKNLSFLHFFVRI